MKRLIKKLVLRRDTIRTLSDIEHAAVNAGAEAYCTADTRLISGCGADPTNPKSPPTK